MKRFGGQSTNTYIFAYYFLVVVLSCVKRSGFEWFVELMRVLQVRLNTVLEVLGIRAEAAAVPLKLEFSGAIISHHKTLKEAGLCDKAEISVQGEDEPRAKNDGAGRQGEHPIYNYAARGGKAADVQLVLDFYPDRVNTKDRVIIVGAPLAAGDGDCAAG